MSTYWLFVFLPLSFAAGFIAGFLACIFMISAAEEGEAGDPRIPRHFRR